MHTQGDATGKTTQKATRWCKCAQCATVEAGRARAAKSGMVDKAALVACGCLGDIRVIKSMCLAVRHRGWVIFILPPYNALGIITVILSCLSLRVRLPLPALTT